MGVMATAKKRAPAKGKRQKAAEEAEKAMRDLGLVERQDEPLVTELVVLATDLDKLGRESYMYPQVVRLFHDVEERLIARYFGDADEGDEQLSIADRLAAMGDSQD